MPANGRLFVGVLLGSPGADPVRLVTAASLVSTLSLPTDGCSLAGVVSVA